MTIVSYLQLNHPALGTAGGAGLHTSIESIYSKIGDNIADRLITTIGLANAATVTLEHNFNTAFADLRWDLYLYNSGTTELTRITDTTSPALSAFALVANGVDATGKVDLTNSSGASRDLALVIFRDPISLSSDGSNDVKDVLVTSKTERDVLTYDAATLKWKNKRPAGATKFVESGGQYASVTAAAAAAVAGDVVLVMSSTTEAAGDLILSVAGVRWVWMPNIVTTLTGSLTNGLRVTGTNITLLDMQLKLTPTGTQARGLSIEAADCMVDRGKIELATAQTLTDAVHVTSSGARTYVQASLLASLGTITNGLTNNDGASNANVWGS